MIDEEPTAFPVKAEPYSRDDKLGMTLRDYFASKAMQAMLSKDIEYHQKYKFFDLADYSYKCADAMLKERQP